MTPRRLFPSLITVACVLGAAPAAATANDVAQASSGNWSGYVIGGSATPQRFAGVSGSWTQPTANCSTSASRYAAFWIGLGGSGQAQALEQAGTEADCSSDGQPSYFAWYELVPQAPVHLALAVHPGDRMTSTVSVSGSSVRIQLSDLTSGQSADRTLTMATPDVSGGMDRRGTVGVPIVGLRLHAVAVDRLRHRELHRRARGHHRRAHRDDLRRPMDRVRVSLGGTSSADGGPQFSSDQRPAGATPGRLSSDGSAFDVTWSAAGSATATGTAGQAASGSGNMGSGYPDPYGGGGYLYVVPGSGGSSDGYGGSGYSYGGSGYGYGDPAGYGYVDPAAGAY